MENRTYFDYSQYDLYRKCPQSYKWKYKDNRVPKTPPNLYYALPGIVIQKVFELFYNNQWYLKRSACRDFMYSKVPEIYEQTLKYITVDWNSRIAKKTKHAVYEECLGMIGKNLDLIKEKRLLGKIAKSEFKIISFFGNNKYVTLTSRLDFFIQNQEGLQILDGKATTNKKNYLDDPTQLLFYAMIHKYKYMKYPDKIGYWFWRDAEINYVDFTEEKIEALREGIKDVLYKIYKRKFEATPEYKSCMFCNYQDECLERKKFIAEKQSEKETKFTEDDLKAFE